MSLSRSATARFRPVLALPASVRPLSVSRPAPFPRQLPSASAPAAAAAAAARQPLPQGRTPPLPTTFLEPEHEQADEYESEGAAAELAASSAASRAARKAARQAVKPAVSVSSVKVDLPAEDAKVEYKVEEKNAQGKVQKWNKNHLFVRHIPHGVRNEDLKSAFEGAGIKIKNVRIMVWPRRDGRFVSRGFGWVALEDEAQMKAAMRLDKMRINDIPIQIEQMKQRLEGSFDRPPKPEPEREPGYYDRTPIRELRARANPRPQLIDDRPYGVKSSKRAAYLLRQDRKRYGPKPGDRMHEVDEGRLRGHDARREEGEVLVRRPVAAEES